MEQIKVSKNLYKGDVISSFTTLIILADEKKSVCFQHAWNNTWAVRPASFLINWPLATLARMRLYTTKRIDQ